jgi:hypothetical protein
LKTPWRQKMSEERDEEGLDREAGEMPWERGGETTAPGRAEEPEPDAPEPTDNGVDTPEVTNDGTDAQPSEQEAHDDLGNTWAEPQSFGNEGLEDEDGDQLDQDQLQGDRPHFALIGWRSIDRMKEVFVPPQDFDSLKVGTSDNARVFLVQGNGHAGKLTAAVNLCYRLAGDKFPQGGIWTYRRRPVEPFTLLEAVESSFWPALKEADRAWPSDTFVIIRDAFEKSILTEELNEAEVDQLTTALREQKSFLLLTTEIDPVRLAALGANLLVVGDIDSQKVLENHLTFYQAPENGGLTTEVAAEVCKSWRAVAETLRTPDLINQFCRRIIEEQIRDHKGFVALAEEIGKLAIVDLRAWFDKLALDAQLFVMMAYLFEGLDLDTLEKLYLEAVARLHREGAVWMRDSRRLCLLYLQEALGPDGVGDEGVEFADAAVRRQVAWQVGNRRLLLASILYPIVAEALSLPIWREAGRRAVLGVALGKLGIYDRGMFAESLDLLAKSRSGLTGSLRNSFAAIPGYAMTESLRRTSTAQAGVVLGTLQRWVGSGHPDLLWTAGAAIWRVYQVAMTLEGRGDGDGGEKKPDLVTRLRRYLKDMVLAYAHLGPNVLQRLEKEAAAGRSDRKETDRAYGARLYEISREGKNCASFAIERIGRVDVQGMVDLSLEWLRLSDKNLSDVALRAARLTFQNLAKAAQTPSLERYRPILALLQAVIVEAQPVAYVTRAAFGLAKWLRSPVWREALVGSLLELLRTANSQGRARLREALSRYWSESPVPEAREIARALIARSYSMEGVLTESPALGHCLLIIDPELILGRAPRKALDRVAQQQAERREGAILQILAMVEARMKVTVLLLGAQEASTSDNGGLRLTSDLPLHRLMRPGVQNVAPDGVRMILLLTSGPVIDLEDGLDAVSAEHKLVIAANCELEVPLGTELLRVGRDLSARDLETLEAKLRLICARAQAALDPAGWEPLLERLSVCIADLDAAPEDTLAAWAAQLDQLDKFPGDTTGHDPAKKILCALLRLAVSDLDACLRIVRAWLMGGTDLERPMAAATAVALLRAVTDAPGIWGGLAPQRTFDELAEPLARSGKDGTDAMLETVERWLAEPTLAEVLAGAVEDGRCRLLRWAEEAAPQQVAAFQEALKPLRKSLEDAELGPSGEILDAVFDRLRVRLAMGRPRPLPDLAAGETFGVIVIDASARWGQLAADLFSRFNQPPTSLKPLLYRLGERWPSWVAGDPNPKPADLSPVGVRLPRLIGPILNELSPAAVSFLVVLSGEMWIDGEDWIDSPWRERIFTFRQLPDAPFRPVLAAFPHRPDQEKEEVDLMELVLKKQPMGGAEEAA